MTAYGRKRAANATGYPRDESFRYDGMFTSKNFNCALPAAEGVAIKEVVVKLGHLPDPAGGAAFPSMSHPRSRGV
jgi:hypothetical protein